ncbi:triose-phosphate transporter family-domain-containing protein [Thelonectria olida]|uniref:Triose-phosphate transporter family-domain-containing protein n=1 Tax=Thelonectria olida TaxID=1576542 RepID=A0A9P8WJI6_9HYPO|nr:triose-phosphate transporter family-domain-containing protein [Thelonectria olida]
MGASIRLEEGSLAAEKSAMASPMRAKLQASLYIVNWMFFSTATIIFNKWLLDNAGFHYPIILTTWHLIFATVATQILARTTTILDSRHDVPLTGRLFLRTIIPLGFLLSASLILANIVYLHLSVAFIQMLKAGGPVAVLLISWSWGVMKPDLETFFNISVIVFGIVLASLGEIDFSWFGLIIQIAGTVCEGARLVMIQIMLNAEGMQMDPLVSLYYFAPVGTVINLFFALIFEGSSFEWAAVEKAGFGMLFLNGFVAFFLNVASVFLIGKTSGLVMSLSGILKSIILVGASVLIWGTQITLMQAIGYTIALGGLTVYSVGRDELGKQWNVAKDWASDTWDGETSRDSKLALPTARSVVIMLLGLMTVVICGLVWYYHTPEAGKVMGKLEGSKDDILRLLDLS